MAPSLSWLLVRVSPQITRIINNHVLHVATASLSERKRLLKVKMTCYRIGFEHVPIDSQLRVNQLSIICQSCCPDVERDDMRPGAAGTTITGRRKFPVADPQLMPDMDARRLNATTFLAPLAPRMREIALPGTSPPSFGRFPLHSKDKNGNSSEIIRGKRAISILPFIE